MTRRILIALGLLALALLLLYPLAHASAQEHRHPAADMPIHEKFYSTWFMPDGRNHLCAPMPSQAYPPDTVFCFTLGIGG